MKTNCWLIFGTMVATGAVAQVNTNALPEIPAPVNLTAPAAPETGGAVAAPAAKKSAPVTHKHRVVKKISEPSVTLVPGAATVVSPNLNVRGQAGLKGEAVGHLKNGDTVTVISQINLDKHAADEPAQWAKISLPAGPSVWVNNHFVDATSKTVTARKLNLRAGPGENYSVLGVLEKGESINTLSTKGDWMQIEVPSNAFAFVAAMYLKQEVAAPVEPVKTEALIVVPPPATSDVTEPQPVATQPTPAAESETNATLEAEATTNTVVAAPEAVETNLPPRVFTHEGYVRSSVSLVAPTYYELYDPASGNVINYLYSTTTNLNLSRYNGFQIVATGEEGIDPRWQRSPVMTLQKIYVVSTNPPVNFQRVASPRASQQRR